MKIHFKAFTTIIFILIFASALFVGCSSIDFNISFDKVYGLKKNDDVIFDESVVGKVNKIFYTTEASFLVTVQIADNYSNAATQYSKFYIDYSPIKEGEKAVIIILSKPGGNVLENGVTIQGQTKLVAALPELNEIQPFFKNLEEQLNKLLNDFQKIPESDEFKDMKEKLKIFGEQLAISGKELKEKLKIEVLPKIKKELDNLIKELEQQGEEDKAQSLEDEFKNLQSI